MSSVFRITAVLFVLLAPVLARATTPGDLCTGDPCVIASSANLDNGSTLNFGAVDVIVAEDVVLSVDGGAASVSFEANSLVLEPGAEIRPTTPGDYGLQVSIYTNGGNIELRADGGKKAILDLSGTAAGNGGDLQATANGAGADLLFDGVVDARGGVGWIGLQAGRNVRVADIDTTGLGSLDAIGSPIEIEAGGTIDVVGDLLSGAPGVGGEGSDQYLTAGTGIHTHPGSKIDVSCSGADCVTGILSWSTTTGDILHEGELIGTTPSSLDGSEAAFIYASAGGSIVLSGPVDFHAGNNGNAYDNEFFADEDVIVGASIKVGSKGPNGTGGSVALLGRHVSVQEQIDISGGGQGTGTISIQADLSATVSAKLTADASNGGDAGSIEVQGCDVTVASTARLEALAGSTGSIRLAGGRRVRVEGQLKAGAENRVEWDLNYPELLGSVTPAAIITQTADSSGCGSLAMCGNGLVDVGEQCDDGNTVDGDCCSMACAAEALGNPCGIDWGLCAASQCDGLGACGVATPGAACFQTVDPLRSQLKFADKDADRGDLAFFRWSRGDEVLPGALPDPVSADDVELCVYGPAGEPIFRAAAPAGGTCATKPCWKAKKTGFVYADKERTPDGLIKVQLKAGDALKSKAFVKGKGENLPALPTLPLPLPVTAQIQAANGACWGASFSSLGVLRNTPEQFKGRSD